MTISERIYALLRERKMTPAELSDRTGIARSTISDWKTKKTNPAADRIMTLCEVLEITPYELLTGKAEEDEVQFLSDYRKLTPEQKENLKKHMEQLRKEHKEKRPDES